MSVAILKAKLAAGLYPPGISAQQGIDALEEIKTTEAERDELRRRLEVFAGDIAYKLGIRYTEPVAKGECVYLKALEEMKERLSARLAEAEAKTERYERGYHEAQAQIDRTLENSLEDQEELEARIKDAEKRAEEAEENLEEFKLLYKRFIDAAAGKDESARLANKCADIASARAGRWERWANEAQAENAAHLATIAVLKNGKACPTCLGALNETGACIECSETGNYAERLEKALRGLLDRITSEVWMDVETATWVRHQAKEQIDIAQAALSEEGAATDMHSRLSAAEAETEQSKKKLAELDAERADFVALHRGLADEQCGIYHQAKLAAEAEAGRYREALEFYAKESNHEQHYLPARETLADSMVQLDKGSVARVALRGKDGIHPASFGALWIKEGWATKEEVEEMTKLGVSLDEYRKTHPAGLKGQSNDTERAG